LCEKYQRRNRACSLRSKPSLTQVQTRPRSILRKFVLSKARSRPAGSSWSLGAASSATGRAWRRRRTTSPRWCRPPRPAPRCACPKPSPIRRSRSSKITKQGNKEKKRRKENTQINLIVGGCGLWSQSSSAHYKTYFYNGQALSAHSLKTRVLGEWRAIIE